MHLRIFFFPDGFLIVPTLLINNPSFIHCFQMPLLSYVNSHIYFALFLDSVNLYGLAPIPHGFGFLFFPPRCFHYSSCMIGFNT